MTYLGGSCFDGGFADSTPLSEVTHTSPFAAGNAGYRLTNIGLAFSRRGGGGFNGWLLALLEALWQGRVVTKSKGWDCVCLAWSLDFVEEQI